MNKFTFFNSSMNVGGVPRVISLWSNYFVEHNYEVEIVSNIESELFYDFDQKIKYSVLGIDRFKQNNFLKTLVKIYRFFKDRKNETMVFNKSLYIPYLYLLKKFKCIDTTDKLVYFAHGGSSDFITMYDNLRNYMIANTFDHIIALHDDYDSFDKSSIRKSLKRKIVDFIIKNQWIEVKSKIVYIPNPVTFYSNEASTLLQKNILAVGRLDKIKGFDLLIKAWKLICEDHKDWKLNIVGSGEEEDNLKKLCDELNIENIELIPQQANIKDYYLNSSIYVMSSREEGMPMVVVEAMECGLPIVAFDNVGAKFLVRHAENGLMCKVGDVETLSKNLKELIDDDLLREKFGKKSKEYAKAFHIENIAYKWEPIIGNIND